MGNDRIKVLSIVLLMALMVIISGCASRPAAPPGSVASIGEAVMCHSFDPSNGPSQMSNTFSPNDAWIICAVKVNTAPSGTMLKSVWQYPDGSTREQTTEASGTGYYSFTVKPKAYSIGKYSNKANDFPVGSYTVTLFLNGEEKSSLKFNVQK